MGTYLYTGKLVHYKEDDFKNVEGDYIVFSNHKHATGDIDKRVHCVPYKHLNDINQYDYKHKQVRLIDCDKSSEIRDLVADKLTNWDYLSVQTHEQLFDARVRWDYKISSLSKYKLDFDTLNRVLTEDDVLKIIDDIDESRCDTDVEDGLTEYGYWVQYFNNMIKEIKDGVIIYRL